MEIFITLKKYNTRQQREEGDYLVRIFSPPHNSVERIYKKWDIPINIHR